MNIKNYKNYKKKKWKYKNYNWIDLSLDLKISTLLSASLTSSGSLFHSWAHL